MALLHNPKPNAVARIVLVMTGLAATALAIAGAVLPGLPTTPFLLIALWAFARSSERLYGWLEHIPVLKSALKEAHRFEQKRAIRPSIKAVALVVAWGSVVFSGLTFGLERPVIFAIIIAAVIGATIFMWIIPTDRD